MDSELFKRIKRLVKNEKKVILLNEAGDDALVIQSLDAYEEENFGWDDSKFNFDDDDDEVDYEDEYDESENLDDIFKTQEEKKPEPVAVKPEEKAAEDKEDQELLRKVNEDIAKWREEQKQNEQVENLPQKDASENKKDMDLGEEERYYLEPLE